MHVPHFTLRVRHGMHAFCFKTNGILGVFADGSMARSLDGLFIPRIGGAPCQITSASGTQEGLFSWDLFAM